METRKRILYGPEHTPDLKLVIALSRAVNAHNRAALEVFRKHGLTMAQFAVLEVLHHKGPMKIGEISEKILSTSGNMTVVIQNMERDGLIECCKHPRDNRARLIVITDNGAKKLQNLFPEYLEAMTRVFSPVAGEEKQIIAQALKKILR